MRRLSVYFLVLAAGLLLFAGACKTVDEAEKKETPEASDDEQESEMSDEEKEAEKRAKILERQERLGALIGQRIPSSDDGLVECSGEWNTDQPHPHKPGAREVEYLCIESRVNPSDHPEPTSVERTTFVIADDEDDVAEVTELDSTLADREERQERWELLVDHFEDRDACSRSDENETEVEFECDEFDVAVSWEPDLDHFGVRYTSK